MTTEREREREREREANTCRPKIALAQRRPLLFRHQSTPNVNWIIRKWILAEHNTIACQAILTSYSAKKEKKMRWELSRLFLYSFLPDASTPISHFLDLVLLLSVPSNHSHLRQSFYGFSSLLPTLLFFKFSFWSSYFDFRFIYAYFN